MKHFSREFSLVLSLSLLGCSSAPAAGTEPSPAPEATGAQARALALAPDGSWIASVSASRDRFAYLTDTAAGADGVLTGKLFVGRVGGLVVQDQQLTARAAEATFAGGDTLYYLAQPTEVADHGGALRRWGELHAWLPRAAEPVSLGEHVAYRKLAEDGSAALWMQQRGDGDEAPGEVMAVRPSWCGASCAPLRLIEGVRPGEVTLVMDPSGRQAAAVVRQPLGPARLLVGDLERREVGEMAVTSEVRLPLFVGDRLAWVEGKDRLVIADGQRRRVIPVAGRVEAMAGGGDRLVLKISSGEASGAHGSVSNGGLSLSTDAIEAQHGVERLYALDLARREGALTELAPRAVASMAIHGGEGRWLFYSTAKPDAQGRQDLWGLDLETGRTAQVGQQTQGPRSVVVSMDGKAARFFESYDSAARRGDLAVASLPDLAVSPVAQGIGRVSFEVGTSRLLYIEPSSAAAAAGKLRVWDGAARDTGLDGVFAFAQSLSSPSELLVSRQGGAQAGGIYAVPSP